MLRHRALTTVCKRFAAHMVFCRNIPPQLYSSTQKKLCKAKKQNWKPRSFSREKPLGCGKKGTAPAFPTKWITPWIHALSTVYNKDFRSTSTLMMPLNGLPLQNSPKSRHATEAGLSAFRISLTDDGTCFRRTLLSDKLYPSFCNVFLQSHYSIDAKSAYLCTLSQLFWCTCLVISIIIPNFAPQFCK